MEMIIILALGVGAMWLMTSRTRKQQREALSFRDNLQPGQEVQTGSGLLGTVVEVEDGIVTLESTPGTRTRWLIAAIARLVEPPVEDEDETDDEDAEDEWDDVDEIEQDEVIEVPDDLSTLPPARGDDESGGLEKKQQ